MAWSWQRRSTFSRQMMRPAADGTINVRRAEVPLPAVKPGLTFRGLRRSHQVWLVEDGVPEIVQAARLGHALVAGALQLKGRLAPGLEQQMLVQLQARYVNAVENASPRMRMFLAAATGGSVRGCRGEA